MVLDTLVYSPLNYLKRLVAREYIIEVHTCTLVGGLVNFYEWVWFPFFVYSQLQQKLLQLKACFLRQTSKNKLRTTHLCRCLLCTNCEQSTDVPQSQTIPVRAFPIADRKPAPSQQKSVVILMYLILVQDTVQTCICPQQIYQYFGTEFFFYSGIRIFNHLPSTIKDLSYDEKLFKLALKRLLLANAFYCLGEYFDWK